MSIHEFPTNQYQIIKPLLGKYSRFPVVNAIIEGNSPGRIFVDDPVNPHSAFVLTDAGFSYLLGVSENSTFNKAFSLLVTDEIFPKIKQSDDPSLIFYPLTDGWESPLKGMLKGFTVYEIFRKHFAFKQDVFKSLSTGLDQIPEGLSLRQLDQALLKKFAADMHPWASPQAFLAKGIGFWLLRGDEIVSECSSVFASSSAVEINIFTAERYRRRGFSRITAVAFIKECLQRGLYPNWECWWDNEPSIMLAQKLGFEPRDDHPVFLVELG